MNYTKQLIELLDKENPALSEMGEITGEKLVEYFRNRTKPVYLFSLKDAEELKDDQIIDDAEKVMEHDIFGHKFNGPIDWTFNPTTETSRDNE